MATPAFSSCKSIDPAKDFVIDLDVFVNETTLNFGPLHHTKQLLANNSYTISQSFYSNLSQFALEPTYPYPKLVHWVIFDFVPSTKQVISYDGSKIILSVNAQVVRKALCLPLPTPEVVQFTEEDSLAIIKALSPD